ncbi:MAG: hypothetical protein QOK12_2365 [Mycobacterium sp.]|nr:hypothetical protein [Mycobacterium sp.]
MSTTLALAPSSAHRIHEIDTPLIPVTQVIASLGSQPTITVPMIAGAVPDVDGIWRYLTETAEFFDVPMPDRDALHAALDRFAGATAGRDRALIAATVTLLEIDGSPDFVVTGAVVDPIGSTAVRIAGCDTAPQVPRPTDPLWLRMAARTTSRAPVDQIQRWVNDGGYADGVPAGTLAGAPLLGALVFDTAAGLVGIDNPEPTSILDLLDHCGVTTGIRRVDARPAGADRAWWISPGFQTHPVASIADTVFDVDVEVRPPFLGSR